MTQRQAAPSACSRILARVPVPRPVAQLVETLARWLSARPLTQPEPSPSCQPRGEHPSHVGSWKIRDVLGRGISATVYRVTPEWASGDRAEFALKLHAPGLAGDRLARQRFAREIEILRSLRHDNVVQMVECGEYHGRMFLVMELVKGERLDAAMHRRDASLATRMDWAIQMARALGAIHSAGVLHRDLKPDNILVDRSGCVKLADFGMARASSRASSARTAFGVLPGAPAYVAPEALLGQAADMHTDLYSLGVVLYELFTGRLPYDAQTVPQFLQAHVVALPIPPRQLAPDLPRDLEALLLRLLRKHPHERPSSAAAVEQELNALRVAPGWLPSPRSLARRTP